jgi:DNA-binding transcriptional LysR family regulator
VKAAQELGVAQPTLSKSLARLEDELGAALFHRSGAGAKATPIGLLVVERARRIIDRATQLNREIELVAGGSAGDVRIGIGAAVSEVFVPRLVERVVRAFPKLRLTTRAGVRAEQLSALLAGQVDMMIGAIETDLEGLDLDVTPVLADRIVAVAAPGHPLTTAGRIGGREFIGYPTSSPTQTSLLSVASVLGLPEQEPIFTALTANDYGAILHLAREGLVTSMGPAHIYADDVAKGALVELDLPIGRVLRSAAIMTRPAALSPILSQIVKLAQGLAIDLGIAPT